MADDKPVSQDRTVVGTKQAGKITARSTSSDVAAFLEAAKVSDPTGAGRLIFSLDATMSRQPTWDRACHFQSSMFEAVARIGGLSVQLVYFRGFGECKASRWVMNSTALRDIMSSIVCKGGQTQIAKVLKHAARENARQRLSALIFIGDAMEEDVDRICHLAGELGLKGVRAFMFQEGHDRLTENTFRQIAKLTGGAFFHLGPESARNLAELLGAIAVYASAGRKALEASSGQGARLLLEQMTHGSGKGGRGK